MALNDVPINNIIAYVNLVDVDSFIDGHIEQQQKHDEPSRRHLSLKIF